MHVQLRAQYKITLTAAEYRIMGLALAGKVKRQADIKAAAQLNKRLLALRATTLKQMAGQAELTNAKVAALPREEVEEKEAPEEVEVECEELQLTSM